MKTEALKVKELSSWVRSNSEHWLLVDAQSRMAAKYGRAVPAGPKGAKEIFWLRVFAPAYRRLPWKVRSAVIQRMPGSHRQNWSSSSTPPRHPAV